MGEELLSTGTVAKELGVSKGAVLRALERGDLKAARYLPGGAVRYLVADVDAYRQSLLREPPSASRRPPRRANGVYALNPVPNALPQSEGEGPFRARPSASQEHGESAGGSPPRGERGSATPTYHDAIISRMLELLANAVGAGAACVSRDVVDDWRADYAFDRVGMGVEEGDRIPFDSQFIARLQGGSQTAVIVEDARADMRAVMTGQARLDVGAFVVVPIAQADGQYIGVLYVVYPLPQAIDRGDVASLYAGGEILGGLLDIEGTSGEGACPHGPEALRAISASRCATCERATYNAKPVAGLSGSC